MAPRYPEWDDHSKPAYSELHVARRGNPALRRGSGVQGPPHGLNEPMDTPDKDLLEYIDVFYKRLWLIIGIFFLCVILAYGYAKSVKPIYRSDATLEVLKTNQESFKTIGEQLEKGLNLDEAFATEAEIIRSRSLAKSLVAQMDVAYLREFITSPIRVKIRVVFGLQPMIVSFPWKCKGYTRTVSGVTWKLYCRRT